MAIDETSVFPYVLVDCNCENRRVGGILPCTSLDPLTYPEGVETLLMTDTDASKLEQRRIIKDRVRAGTLEIWYRDWGNDDIIFPYDDFPEEHVSVMYPLHDIHPNDGWKMPSQLILQGDVTTENHVQQYRLKGHVLTEQFAPEEDEIEQKLNVFEAFPAENNQGQFLIDVEISAQLKLTLDDLDVYAPILALREELQANKAETTSDFGTDVSALATWNSRDVTLTLDSTDLTFSVSATGHTTDEDAHLTSWSLVCDVDGGGAYDVNQINAYLATAMREISTANGLKLDGPMGDHAAPLHGREVNFGNLRRYREERGVFVSHVRDDGSEHSIGVIDGNVRILGLDELPAGAGSNLLVPLPSERPRANIIRVAGQTSATTVQCYGFALMAGRYNNARPLQVHNHNALDQPAAVVHLTDRDGTNIATIRPGQHGDFVASYNPDGSGRFIGHVSHARRAIFDGDGSAGTFNDSHYVEIDDDYWGRVLKLKPQRRVIDDDAFSIGTTNIVNGQSIATSLALDTDEYLNVHKPGHCRFIQEAIVETVTGAAGTWPNGHGIRLYRRRGAVLATTTEIHGVRFREFNPTIGTRTYRFEFEDDIEDGDRLAFLFRYPKNPTLAPSEVQLINHYRACFLDQHIDLVEVPS